MIALLATIPHQLLARAEESPRQAGYWRQTASGWESVSWATILRHVQALSEQLIQLGMAPGDRVAIVLPTTVEWEYCNLATLAAGGVVVGVDAHDADDNIRHILSIARPAALFVASPEQYDRLASLLPAPLTFAVVSDPIAGRSDLLALSELLARPRPDRVAWPVPRPDDPATIVFTSGSTGLPKGVPYSHRQLCSAGAAIMDRFPTVKEGARFPCWLPLSNLFQRVLNLCAMMRGAESYFVDSPNTIIANLSEIRPTLFIGVPRFYEKLHGGMEAEIGRRPTVVRRVVRWAQAIGHQFRSAERTGVRPSPTLRMWHALANRLVLRRLRAIAGPDLQFMVSGSAPLPVWLMERFHAMGWLVLEAYGTSENVIPIAINAPSAFRFGSVGRPLPQNEIKLAADNELLVRSDGVFTGYFGEVGVETPLDAEGFLHTGDYARLDTDGFVWLTGRKSDVFKSSTGRRIAPVPIESCLKQLPYVEHVAVFGAQHPVPIALICLNAAVLPWPETEPGSASLPVEALKAIGEDVARMCAGLPAHQRPAGAVVTRNTFSITGGELTSNLKLKRKPIEEKYRTVIDELYAALAANPQRATCLVVEASSRPTS